MPAAGSRAVAAAQADGSWNVLDEVESLTEPPGPHPCTRR